MVYENSSTVPSKTIAGLKIQATDTDLDRAVALTLQLLVGRRPPGRGRRKAS